MSRDDAGEAEARGGDRPGQVPLHRSQPRAGGSLRVRQVLCIEHGFFTAAQALQRQEVISSYVSVTDLIEALQRTGWTVAPTQVVQLPTICCGGCAG